jgi:hypothetical protein
MAKNMTAIAGAATAGSAVFGGPVRVSAARRRKTGCVRRGWDQDSGVAAKERAA